MKRICLNFFAAFIGCLGIRESVSVDNFDPGYHECFEQTGGRFGNFYEVVEHFESLYYSGVAENDTTCVEKFGVIEINFQEYCYMRKEFSKNIAKFKPVGEMYCEVKNMEAMILGCHFFNMYSESMGSYSMRGFKPRYSDAYEMQHPQVIDACANMVFLLLGEFRDKSGEIKQSSNKKNNNKCHRYQ